MKKRANKILEAQAKVAERGEIFSIDEAIDLICEVSFAKFDESVDLAFRLGVDPKHADQMIRSSIVMPAGIGKSVVVCVITSGDKIKQASDAGADFVGQDDIVTKIAGGWLDFDRVIASPDMMGKLGRIGRILGPRGLMPNPKLGTVTPNVVKAIKEQKAGKVEYKTDKTGIVHIPIGKRSFTKEKLRKNFDAITSEIIKAKPSSAKGVYIRSLTISTTMGPGVRINPVEIMS